MTNDEFAAWLRVEFDSISAAEKALEIDRDTLKSMMSGVRRKSGLPHPIPKWVDLMVAGHARRRRGLDLVAAQAALDQHGHISRAAAAIGSYRKALQDRIDSGDLIKRVTPHPRTRSFDMAAAQKMLDSGASYNATGAEVGVSAGLIQKMIVRGALSSPHRRGPKRRTTLDEIETIAALLADGWPNKDIAAATGVRPATISYLISAGRVARPERTGKRPRRP